MARVDWINWKTDPKEIINPEKIEEKVIDCFQNYNTYMNPVVYEQIKYEVERGGLSKDAYCIRGESPLNEIAIDILNKIDEVKNIMSNLQQETKELSEEQKEIEKKQLIEAIKNKLKKEEQVQEKVKTDVDLRNHIIEMGENPEEIITVINDRINKLKYRLEQAERI